MTVLDAISKFAYERIIVEQSMVACWWISVTAQCLVQDAQRRDVACSALNGVQTYHKRRTVPSGMDS